MFGGPGAEGRPYETLALFFDTLTGPDGSFTWRDNFRKRFLNYVCVCGMWMYMTTCFFLFLFLERGSGDEELTISLLFLCSMWNGLPWGVTVFHFCFIEVMINNCLDRSNW